MEQGEPYSIPFTSFCMSAAAFSQSSGVKAAREEMKRLRIDSGWSFKTDVKNFNKDSSFGRGISIGPSPVRSHSSRIPNVWQILRTAESFGVILPASQEDTVFCLTPTLAPKLDWLRPSSSRKDRIRSFNRSPPYDNSISLNDEKSNKNFQKNHKKILTNITQ
nr:MAG TPA: hypothetical protein [Bacteriophage sp.]